jgi:hypothetical protein
VGGRGQVMWPTRLPGGFWKLSGCVVFVIAIALVTTHAERQAQKLQDTQDYIEGAKDVQDALHSLPIDSLDGLRAVPF